MTKALLVPALLFAFCFSAVGQKIEKPTLKPTECTQPQLQTVREGVTLHDAKQYAAAVEKYQQVITVNPDCTVVMYELTMTYYTMGEKAKAMEIALKGSKYKSEHLPLFYTAIANVIDDGGKPDEAVKLYRDAIKILDADKEMSKHLSSVHYNLAVTLTKQKKYADARAELKKAIAYNYNYASPHFLLSIIYNGTKYKVPAFLAAARFLALESGTSRSEISARLIREILKPAPKDDKTGSINIMLDFNAPKDEGDFGMYELFLGTLTTVKGKGDENKTETEMFVDAIGSVIALVDEDEKLKPTFVGKHYIPFVSAMKKKGYTDVLAYLILHKSGDAAASAWLTKNDARVKEFASWSKTFSLN